MSRCAPLLFAAAAFAAAAADAAAAATTAAAAAASAAAPHVSASAAAFGAAPEPWAPLSGGAFSGPPAPFSPDPLVRYQWAPGSFNASLLQSFVIAPTAAGPTRGSPAGSFVNASSCVGAAGGGPCALRVVGNGTLIVDFGVESASWFEFDSADLQDADACALVLGISEFATDSEGGWVGGYKTGGAAKYGSGCGAGAAACTYRLETNGELYEGVRFAMVTLPAAPSRPFTISALRLVAQARPVNYTGAFHSSGDPALERAWYTGACKYKKGEPAHTCQQPRAHSHDRPASCGDPAMTRARPPKP